MRQIWIDEVTAFEEDDDPVKKEYRISTEGIRFEEDWPGMFFRGDDALYVAALITSLWSRAGEDPPHELVVLKEYADYVFREVPFKQWTDEQGHSIIEPIGPEGELIEDAEKVSVQRDGSVSREEEDGEESEGDDGS
jgi:hypothetical protein